MACLGSLGHGPDRGHGRALGDVNHAENVAHFGVRQCTSRGDRHMVRQRAGRGSLPRSELGRFGSQPSCGSPGMRAFDAPHPTGKLGQDRGLIAQPGSDLEDALMRLGAEEVGHQRDYEGLRDRLIEADRQRRSGVGWRGPLARYWRGSGWRSGHKRRARARRGRRGLERADPLWRQAQRLPRRSQLAGGRGADRRPLRERGAARTGPPHAWGSPRFPGSAAARRG
jgi:hypothetical protein